MFFQDFSEFTSKNKEPVPPFRFLVLMGKHPIPFQTVSGIGMKRDFQYISEGGRNDYAIRLINPQTTPYEITFSRTLPSGGGIRDPLLSDYYCNTGKNPAFVMQQCRNIRGASVHVIVFGMDYAAKAMYSFVAQGLAEWSIDDLDSMAGSRYITETMTIVHNGIKRMSVPRLKLTNIGFDLLV